MKIKYISDLHLEFQTLDPEDMEPADVIILAGDIQVWTIAGTTMFEWMNLLPTNHVIFVPGNHEFYNGGKIKKIKSEMEMVLQKYPKIDMLWNSSVVIDGQTFLGTPLFTNFDDENRYCMEQSQKGISDFQYKNTMYDEENYWTPWVMKEHWKEAVKFLGENIVLGNEIVVTHWAPSYLSCDPEFEGDALNGYFMNKMDKFIETLQPAVWVHGHGHNSVDYMIGDTRILNNPRGYIPHQPNPEFDVNKYFEVSL